MDNDIVSNFIDTIPFITSTSITIRFMELHLNSYCIEKSDLINYIEKIAKVFIFNKYNIKCFNDSLINIYLSDAYILLQKVVTMKNIYKISKIDYTQHIWDKKFMYNTKELIFSDTFSNKSIIPYLPFNWMQLSVIELIIIEAKWEIFKNIEIIRYNINWFHKLIKKISGVKAKVPSINFNWLDTNVSFITLSHICEKFKILIKIETYRGNAILHMQRILKFNKYHIGEYIHFYFLDKWLEYDIQILKNLEKKLIIIIKLENLRAKIVKLSFTFYINTGIQLELPRIPYNWCCMEIKDLEAIINIFEIIHNIETKRNLIISHIRLYIKQTTPNIILCDYNPKYINFSHKNAILYKINHNLSFIYKKITNICNLENKYDISKEIQDSLNCGIMNLYKYKVYLMINWTEQINN